MDILIPDSRFQIPDSRFQIPDSRFQIPDSRFQIRGEFGYERKQSAHGYKNTRLRLVCQQKSALFFKNSYKHEKPSVSEEIETGRGKAV